MNYNDNELIEQLRKHIEGELTIPGKFYPDVSKWTDTSVNTFGTSHMNRLNQGAIQYLRDMEAMRQDEINHDWQGQWERKLKQDKFNAAHPQKPLPERALPKINKRSWLTRRKPQVEYTSLAAHLQDTVGDTQTYSWDSSKPSVASVVNKNSNTTTVTGVAEGKANINAHLQTVDDSGNTATSSGYTTITVTAAPTTKAHAKTATVSLSNTTATANTAFTCNASLSNVQEPDDGSYTYTWFFSGPTNGTLAFNSTTSSTATISGTPATSGTVTVKCNIKDSYGTYATVTAGTITVNAAPSNAAHVPTTATGCTADGSWNGSNKHGVYQHRLFHSGITNDDGTFTYLWGWNGAAPSGISYDTPTASDTYVSGTAAAAGTFHGTCTVTDTYGGVVVQTWTDTIG
ncbi:hypothetical protein [Klebsiella quasivariicola]|uniref:Ig-like domain-containing protein n=1 Tax=Klebsiella quasivariicola TaxID=2026240 RepID=A0A8B4TPB8_9ENTR|nr:hypothetical protein [Klebsiella quasivariicola]SXD86835.1 Uncharacterised protein [Klebsiella quasivariicola]